MKDDDALLTVAHLKAELATLKKMTYVVVGMTLALAIKAFLL